MDNRIMRTPTQETVVYSKESLTTENRLEIIDEGIRKKYLARLSEMKIAPIGELPPLEEDLIKC